MKAMSYVLANWKTSVLGLAPFFGGLLSMCMGAASLLHIPVAGATVTGEPWQMLGNGLMMVSTGMAAFAAKDANVTGGTKPNA